MDVKCIRRYDDSKIADSLVEKLPAPTYKYSDKKIADFYKPSKLDENSFSFSLINEKSIFDTLENINDSKAPGFDNIHGNFLKDSREVLSKSIADIFNLSMMVCKFPTKCKVASKDQTYF